MFTLIKLINVNNCCSNNHKKCLCRSQAQVYENTKFFRHTFLPMRIKLHELLVVLLFYAVLCS